MRQEWEGKACPACAADGVVTHGQYDASIDDGMFAVICLRCGRRTDDYLNWQNALAAWNADQIIADQIIAPALLEAKESI